MSAIARNTIKGRPRVVAMLATISLSRSTARAWVMARARFFSTVVAMMELAPNTGP